MKKKIGGIQKWFKEFVEKRAETNSFLEKMITKKYPKRNDKEKTGYRNRQK